MVLIIKIVDRRGIDSIFDYFLLIFSEINLSDYFSEMSGPSFRSFSSPATASESPDDTHESHENQDIKDEQKNTNDTHIEVFSGMK